MTDSEKLAAIQAKLNILKSRHFQIDSLHTQGKNASASIHSYIDHPSMPDSSKVSYSVPHCNNVASCNNSLTTHLGNTEADYDAIQDILDA